MENWLDPVVEINLALGVPEPLARAHARLGVAITRGLPLDLLAMRDVKAVDDAMYAFIDIYVGWLRQHAAPGA